MDTIITGRLRLRNWEIEDAEDLFAYCQDSEVGPMAGWAPHASREASKEILLWLSKAQESWAIEHLELHKVIGSVGFRPEPCAKEVKAKELGYALGRLYWGQGYMGEAVGAVLQYGFCREKLELVTAGHFPGNHRSQRVLQKAGFVYEGRLRSIFRLYNGTVMDICRYSLLAQEYFKGQGGGRSDKASAL